MQIGKFKISEFILTFILFIVLISLIAYFSTKSDIEKERTKQLEVQRELEYIKVKEEIINEQTYNE